jgi:hypothetical protein
MTCEPITHSMHMYARLGCCILHYDCSLFAYLSLIDVIVISYRDVSMFSLLHQKKLYCFCDRSVREMACRSRKRVALAM